MKNLFLKRTRPNGRAVLKTVVVVHVIAVMGLLQFSAFHALSDAASYEQRLKCLEHFEKLTHYVCKAFGNRKNIVNQCAAHQKQQKELFVWKREIEFKKPLDRILFPDARFVKEESGYVGGYYKLRDPSKSKQPFVFYRFNENRTRLSFHESYRMSDIQSHRSVSQWMRARIQLLQRFFKPSKVQQKENAEYQLPSRKIASDLQANPLLLGMLNEADADGCIQE